MHAARVGRGEDRAHRDGALPRLRAVGFPRLLAPAAPKPTDAATTRSQHGDWIPH
jgi:hypothetical protein